VLDVGHTAQVPGAMSARGVPEYEFNLRLAGQVDAALKGAGFSASQILVTSGSARRGLAARVARANASRAELFLSLHHDSVPEQFLETWEHDGKPQRYSDRFGGHSLFVSLENGQAEASLRFARALGTALRGAGLRYTPHYADPIMGWRQRDLLDAEAGVYRFDELVVLRRTAMPAVLFEAGSIVALPRGHEGARGGIEVVRGRIDARVVLDDLEEREKVRPDAMSLGLDHRAAPQALDRVPDRGEELVDSLGMSLRHPGI
jgi:N-acetylmuramoyl-L-alanine amidase